MKTPTATVFLNTSYKKKNGECAVYIVVHIDYKSLKFNTGISCLEEKWDKKKKRIKGNSQKTKDDNLVIADSMAQMNDIFVRYRLQHQQLTADLLKNEWKNPSRRIDFYAFFEEALAERGNELRPQTLKNHKSEINKLREFKPTLAFSELNAYFLDRYKRWLKTNKHNSINSIYTSIKVLKVYVSIAIRKGVIQEDPFSGFKNKRVAPERVFLNSKELMDLWRLYNSGRLSPAKNKILRHFLFMCFTGVRVSDLKRLTHGNVVTDLLFFYPVKTRGVKMKPVKVPLNKFALQLIKDDPGAPGEILFDTVSEQKMNKYIKEIAAKAGINKPLTNHSGRHTFATVWLEKTHDLAGLKEMLGHSNIQDTMTYVHITDSMMKQQMNRFEGMLGC